MTRGISLLLVTLMFLVATAVGGARSATAEVPGDPPTFSDPLNVTNRYAPFVPGATKVYRGKTDEGILLVVDKYLEQTRTFDWGGGTVETWILEELEFEDGRLVEISFNYFAQGDDGALYYFGEVVDIYGKKGNVANHEGSWLVGGATDPLDPDDTADAPDPAVFMPSNPEVGDRFKPEDLYPIVDETVRVKEKGLRVKVPAGTYRRCIEVKETTRLDDESELKWYAPGVGVIRVKEEDEILKLVGSTLSQ